MTEKTDTTFVKITNKDIYKTIVDNQKSTDAKFDSMRRENNEKFNKIIRRQDIANGKVNKSLWIASTAFTLTLIVLGYLFQHIMKG